MIPEPTPKTTPTALPCSRPLPAGGSQGAEAVLAGLARHPALISYGSKLSTSLVHPSEHVGEQIAGGAGWRAWGGSDGIGGAAITTGGNGGGADAQPVTSSSSVHSSNAQGVGGKFGMAGDLLEFCGAALIFDPGRLARAGRGAGVGREVGLVARLRSGQRGPRIG